MLIRTRPVPFLRTLRQQAFSLRAAWQMDAAQAQRYAQATAPARLKRLVITGACSVLLFNLFLLSDREVVPDVFWLSVVSRLFVLTPVILLLVAIGHFAERWWLAHVPPWMSELNAAVATMLVAASLGLVMWRSHSPYWAVYHSGLIPLLVFSNLVQRLRFQFAVAVTVFVVLMCLLIPVLAPARPSPYLNLSTPVTIVLWVVALYALASNFNLEMDDRRSFQQAERARSLRGQLEQTQVHLRTMSQMDTLTGLPNRRQFDDYLRTQLEPGTRPGGWSVVLIDVDHFKAFNDRYGHPAGDQCLCMVASGLQVAMQGMPGLLARWGGEEFVAVLPDADAHTAHQLGERMCRVVQALAMRHEASPTAPHVSVSCGVAGSTDVHQGPDIACLLRLADAALYEAKTQGRNRCVAASPQHEPHRHPV
jgi:diguanylate cyclase (GGDEF)-like protein